MLELFQTSSFKKYLKKYKHNKNILQELDYIIDLLIREEKIPEKYKNHKLTGNFSGMMELHLKPDDLLIYFEIKNESITLYAIGSHADLF